MKAVNRAQMQEIDEWAISKIGIPRLVLMENAGKSVAEAISKEFSRTGPVAVFCGKGFNGGDGIVAARHLKNSGIPVSIFILGYSETLKEESKINFNIARLMGIEIWEVRDEADLKKIKDKISDFSLIIDAIFGIGLTGEITGLPARVIELINQRVSRTCRIVAVDVPSGINSDTGEISQPCIAADLTVTMHLPKLGLLKYPASQYAGKIIVADIGIPYENSKFPPATLASPTAERQSWRRAMRAGKIKNSKTAEQKTGDNLEVTDIQFVETIIPRRKVDAHKGSCGSVLVLAGSLGMCGAAVLAASSALRTGSGLVKLGCPKSLASFVNTMAAEIITLPLPETRSQSLSPKAFRQILKIIDQFEVLVIGPGLSTDSGTINLVIKLIESDKIKLPIVLDADALNAISTKLIALKNRKFPTIITPHPGELSRILKIDTARIQANRIKSARLIAKELKIITVLKGAYTVISDGNEKVYLNPTGNPGMASAGMGDVLAGIIGGLIAQGVPIYESAIAGVFIHGMAGDIVSSLKGEHGMLASDLAEAIPYCINSICRK